MPHQPRPKTPGFTLIELLVVIGVIALLVGILLPVLAKARQAGKAAACLSNMRQLGIASTGYQTDNDRHLPQPSSDNDIANAEDRANAIWFNALDYYLQQSGIKGTAAADRNYVSFKQDPAWNDLPSTVQTTSGDRLLEQDDVRTFKMNVYFGHVSVPGTNAQSTEGKRQNQDVAFFKVTHVPQPSDTALIVDGRGHDTPTEDGIVDAASTFGGVYLFAASQLYVGLRHDDGANLTRVDGSAAFSTNPIKTTGSGYRGWYDDDEMAVDLRPDIIFNFRPDDFPAP